MTEPTTEELLEELGERPCPRCEADLRAHLGWCTTEEVHFCAACGAVLRFPDDDDGGGLIVAVDGADLAGRPVGRTVVAPDYNTALEWAGEAWHRSN